MKGTTGIGRQLRQCDDAARDAARRTLPDQILLDAFIQHVKAICFGQLRLEERRETLPKHIEMRTLPMIVQLASTERAIGDPLISRRRHNVGEPSDSSKSAKLSALFC